MTALVPVPAKVDPLPFPTLADRPAGTYNNKAYAWADRIPAVVDAMNAQALATYQNAVVAGEQASSAVGLASAAAQSESNAANSASTATTKANAASASADSAAQSATQAQSGNVELQSRMLGVKTSAPTTDNFGQPLQDGAIYINRNNNSWNWWDGTGWKVGLTDPDVSVVDWANINNVPNTIEGFGITNAVKLSDIKWSNLADKPTTVAGYNISDAVATGGTQSISGTKTFTNGIKFGSQVATSITDLNKHLDLYGGSYGINVTGSRLGHIAPANASHNFTIGGTDYAVISNTGLSVGGNITNSGSITAGGNVTAYSDARLKSQLKRIENPLAKLLSLTGYTYKRNDTGQKQTGLLAQEVFNVLPEAVEIGTTPDQLMSVAYGNMMGLVVEAIKAIDNRLTMQGM